MKQFLFFISLFSTVEIAAQDLKIITTDKSRVDVLILDEEAKNKVLIQTGGNRENTYHKKWTARTFILPDGKVLVEFYDRQAVLIKSLDDFNKLQEVRFLKNAIDNRRKNISYKIDLTAEEGRLIIQDDNPKRLNDFKPDLPEYFDFEVYEMGTGQILFTTRSKDSEHAIIYPDLKTLFSDNNTIEDQTDKPYDHDYVMKRLVAGDALADYEPRRFVVYPKFLKELIKNHRLTLVERKVYVYEFYGNLYKSELGYYILVDEVKQKNGAGRKMRILDLSIYDSLQQVREAQERFVQSRNREVMSEHMYQKISEKYGERFPEFVKSLIDTLPLILNIDREQFSLDSVGVDFVDEAIKWNSNNYALFDTWFPSVLAYYGQVYMLLKNEGKWSMYLDQEGKVWIPQVILNDGSPAWDWIDFFKDLYEGPIPLRWAGDWNGTRKNIRSKNYPHTNN